MRELGFAVVEWNQASRRAGLASGDLHVNEREAQEELDAFVDETAKAGRRERYELARVVLLRDEG